MKPWKNCTNNSSGMSSCGFTTYDWTATISSRGLEERHLLDVLAKHTGRAKEPAQKYFTKGDSLVPQVDKTPRDGATASLANAAHPAANPGRMNRKEYSKQYCGDRSEGRDDR